MSGLELSARLERSDGGVSWGFRLVGGKDFGAPLTIQRVNPGSVAAKCGLEVGDEIRMIGTTLTEGLRHSEAQQLIRDAGNLVELKLERGGRKESHQVSSVSNHAIHSDANANGSVPVVQAQIFNAVPKSFPSRAPASELKTETSVRKEELCGSEKTLTSDADDDFPPPPPLPEELPEPLPGAPSGPPSAFQSARFQESDDADVPHYQGYVDPGIQSRSFKLLQSAMDSGEDISKLKIRASSPARNVPGQKPAIGIKPSLPKDGSVAKPSKPVTSQQYNNPIGLYSAAKVDEEREEQTKQVHEVHTGSEILIDVPVERKTIVLPSKKVVTSTCHEPLAETIDAPMERKKIVIPSSKLPKPEKLDAADLEDSVGKKRYVPSETMKLIQDQESGRHQIQINPKTGAEIKMNQSKKLIQLEQNLEGSFAGGVPPLPTSYKVTSGISADSVSKQTTTPSGTSRISIVKAGEAKTLSAKPGAPKVPVCAQCGSFIRGPYVTALEKTWCPEHFVCDYPGCGASLVDSGFVEENGKLYCERDYELHFAPKCGKCGLGVVGEMMSAMQQKFHTNCFICIKCHLQIPGGYFRIVDGDLYCERDWSIMFQTKCCGCQFPIEDGDLWVDAVSRMWHSDCFKCVFCQVNLDGQSFYAKNGKPYCKKHGSA